MIQNLFVSIVQTPALLVGLLAVLGLILQHKKTTQVIQGGIKTFAGFLILTGGAGILVNSLDPFAKMFQFSLGVQGVVPSNEAVVAIALVDYGSVTAMIMFVGMLVNIALARFTKFKYIFLTGQAMLYVSCLTAVILVSAGFGNGLFTILLGGLFEGTLLTVTPALCQPFMRVITGGDTVAMGHTGNIGYALAGWCGKWFGNKEHSTEDINVPKSMSFLRDSTVSITIVMAIVYIILALMTGQQFVEENLSKGTNYIIYAIVQAGTFAAGFAVVLQGVRMILAEIVPAFQGIAMKLVPNSKPALDVPIIFPYAPNAVLLGFFVSFIVGTLSMFGMVRHSRHHSRCCRSLLLRRCRCHLRQCKRRSSRCNHRRCRQQSAHQLAPAVHPAGPWQPEPRKLDLRGYRLPHPGHYPRQHRRTWRNGPARRHHRLHSPCLPGK